MSLNKIYEIIENKQRVKNYFEKLRVKPNNSNTREHLIAKMNSIYNDKSNSKLAYFYNNIFYPK